MNCCFNLHFGETSTHLIYDLPPVSRHQPSFTTSLDPTISNPATSKSFRNYPTQTRHSATPKQNYRFSPKLSKPPAE